MIIRNSIRCKKCGTELVSESVHDFKTCSCGAVSVDGGLEYLRRVGNREDYEETSIVNDIEEADESDAILPFVGISVSEDCYVNSDDIIPDDRSASTRAIDRMLHNSKPYLPPYFDWDQSPSYKKLTRYIKQFIQDEFYAGALEIIESYGLKAYTDPEEMKGLYILGLQISDALRANPAPNEPLSNDEKALLLNVSDYYFASLFIHIDREVYANEDDLCVIIRHLMKNPLETDAVRELLAFYKERFADSDRLMALEQEAKGFLEEGAVE